MADYEQTTKTNPRRPDCVTKIRMGNRNSVATINFFKLHACTSFNELQTKSRIIVAGNAFRIIA